MSESCQTCKHIQQKNGLYNFTEYSCTKGNFKIERPERCICDLYQESEIMAEQNRIKKFKNDNRFRGLIWYGTNKAVSVAEAEMKERK